MSLPKKCAGSILDLVLPKNLGAPTSVRTVNLMKEPKRCTGAQLEKMRRYYKKHAEERRAAANRRYHDKEKPMAEVNENMELHDSRADPAKMAAELGEAIGGMVARAPVAAILIFEASDGAVCIAALGPPRDLVPLYNVGGDQLQNMLRKALNGANQCG